MSLLYITHQDCLRHEMGAQHPESPARLESIQRSVDQVDWQNRLIPSAAPLLPVHALADVHPQHYVDLLIEQTPQEGYYQVEPDVLLNPFSTTAALRGAGAAVEAVRRVLTGDTSKAFCAVRPPGHHAETAIAMGFCLFNNAALAAEVALKSGIERVAILDFDVHHGNGSVEIFQDRPEVMVCSSFQHPFYPGRYDEVHRKHIVYSPLASGSGSSAFRQAIERDWLPALHQHQPELVIISAGFDAHRLDPLGGLNLETDDYQWITQTIMQIADASAAGRIVSVLEGGYHLDALADAAVVHMRTLSGLT